MESRDGDLAALRRELRARLGLLGAPLQLLAEDVLGEDDARIDWVAVEPDGRLCVVLLAAGAADEGLLARGLAQRAWMQARVPDWQKLVPGLGARADLRPRLLLIATDFSRLVRIAAREADPDGLRLACYRWAPGQSGGSALVVEAVDALPAPRVPQEPPAAPLASVFRSGLGERDFGGNGGSRTSG
jgi:hypothetical protein